MANTIAAGIRRDLVLDAALEAFTARLAPLNIFSTDFSPATLEKGKSVNVGSIPAAAAAANFAGTYTAQDSTANAITVNLDQHDYVEWNLSDTELIESPVLRLERFARQKGFALAKAVFQNILGVVTNANFGAAVFTGAATTFDKDDVMAIGKAADNADWDEDGRALVLDSDYYWELVNDAGITGAADYGGSEGIRQGVIEGIYGFDAHKSTIIPANGENLVGFSCLPNAIAIAMRYLQPQDGIPYNDARPITDPESGIVMGYREWGTPDTGVMHSVLECMWGKALGDAAALDRMVSA